MGVGIKNQPNKKGRHHNTLRVRFWYKSHTEIAVVIYPKCHQCPCCHMLSQNYLYWVLSCNMKSHLMPLFVHLRYDVLPYLHLPLSLLQIPGRFMRAEHIQLLKKYSRDVTEAQMMSEFLGGEYLF